MFGNNPYIKLLKKFYKKTALTPKQISRITKYDELSKDRFINDLLKEHLIEGNTTDRLYISKDDIVVQAGFYETDESKPYRISQKGAQYIRADTITENTIRYIITTCIATAALALSVYNTFFHV